MITIDYRTSQHAVSYERPSAIEQLAAEKLAEANFATGSIDLTHNVAMDEIPD